jgi:hypothetical protein
MHRTEAALEIAEAIPVIWAFRGRPILSRPASFLNVLRLIRHPLSRGLADTPNGIAPAGRTNLGV